MADAPEYVKLGEAAKILDVSPTTIRRWHRKGLLTAYKTPGGQRRFLRSDLDAAIERFEPEDAA